jgi:ribosomal-protein-alanine N-acetyltransferase
MPALERLRADHAPAVLAFELTNRAYFAAHVTDRGDEFFTRFTDHFGAALAEQDAGVCVFHILVAEDGEVLGRFNLYDLHDGTARLGYRVARHVTGRGVATATVRALCGTAASRHALHTLRAAAARTNPASRRVLVKAGFTLTAPADPADLGGNPGDWFTRDLRGPR